MGIDLDGLLACPECLGPLEARPGSYSCAACGSEYPVEDGIPRFYLDDDEYKSREEQTQSKIADEYHDLMALGALRNVWVHDDLRRELLGLPRGALILEVAAGCGEDGLALLRHGFRVVETDVSHRSLALGRQEASLARSAERAAYVVADGERLPFAGELFDAVLIVAGLHHMRSPVRCVEAMFRCVRPDGLVVIGMEPNRWYYSIFRPLGKLVERAVARIGRRQSEKPRSIAEASAEGFRSDDLVAMLESCGGRVLRVTPLWFMCGILHYVCRFVWSIRGRSSDLIGPAWANRLCLWADEAIARVPVIRRWGWNWTAVARKGIAAVGPEATADWTCEGLREPFVAGEMVEVCADRRDEGH